MHGYTAKMQEIPKTMVDLMSKMYEALLNRQPTGVNEEELVAELLTMQSRHSQTRMMKRTKIWLNLLL